VKAAQLFKSIDWKRLEAGMMKPPFEPDVNMLFPVDGCFILFWYIC